MYDDNIVTYFAETDSRNKRFKFGIKAKDRTKHVYVIGKTGMGKSTVLENMAVQDIQNGEGMAFLDPHGKTADLLLDYIPEHRIKDVVYFAPFDLEAPISFNVLEAVDADKRHLVVSGLMSTFKKIWQDAWSARMEYILTNTLLALLEYPDATLLGVNRMYADKEFRKDVVAHITDPTVKAFWTEEFAKYTEKFAAEATPAIQNKIGQFTSNALIRNMIGQPKSSFDLRKMMDEKKILIINLSKGRVGEQNANLLGGMLITKIYLAAMSRADASPALMKSLPQFYLYVDEFQSFATESFADILSEARKYKLNLTIAHQYIEQMEEEVRAAVFGNVGTMIVFRVGAYDAEVLEKEFSPTFLAEDIVNLGVYQVYMKLMIDGVSSQPFSATTLPPIALPPKSMAEEAKAMSRSQFAHPRADVEKAIIESMAPVKPAPSAAPASTYPKTGPASSPAPASKLYPPAAAKSMSIPVAPATIAPRPEYKPAASVMPIPAAAKPVVTALAPAPKPAPMSPAPKAASTPMAPVAPSPVAPKPEKKPELVKPFADAFKALKPEVKTEVPPTVQTQPAKAPAAVSLSTLGQKAPGGKIATPEHKNALQEALAKAMAGNNVKKVPDASVPQKSEVKPAPTIPQKPVSTPPVATPATPSAPQNEVPHDVLRKTLEI